MSEWYVEHMKQKLKDLGYAVIKQDSIKRLQTQASVDKMQFHMAHNGDGLMQSIHGSMGRELGMELLKHAEFKVEDEPGGPYSYMGPRRIFRVSVDVLT